MIRFVYHVISKSFELSEKKGKYKEKNLKFHHCFVTLYLSDDVLKKIQSKHLRVTGKEKQ